jgi:hypothetical protein
VVFDQVTITGTVLPAEEPTAGPCPGDGPEPPACVARTGVRLNEAYLRVNGGEERWLELYNPTAAAVNLGGYYLTNDAADLTRFQIPGISLPSKGFVTFTESELGFSLTPAEPGEVGDRIFIALSEPLPANRVVDAFNFEPLHTGYSEARIGGDDLEFTPAADPTFEAANRVSTTTDIVFNEILYHAIDEDRRKEWVELYNRGSVAHDLTGFAISDGLDFAMPDGTEIPAGGYLIVARDPQLVRGIYGLGAEVVGPETQEALDAFGVLRDDGERLTLTDPLGRTVDTVRYHDGGEWPRWADGHGSSLELIDVRQDNRRGQAWDASDDSAKAAVQSYAYTARHGNRDSELAIALLSRGIAVIDDLSVSQGGAAPVDAVLIESNQAWRYFKGTVEPPATWINSGFNDASWLTGNTGIGYGDGDDATQLLDMQEILPDQPGYMTIFCRKTFNVANTAAINQLILVLAVDDGFYAYLNGTLVASDNVTSPGFNAPAPNAPAEPIAPIEYDITAFKNVLVNGTNTLAVQVHNAGLGSTDLSFIPRLVNRTAGGGGTERLANGNFNANTSGWVLEGTHVRSGRTTQNPIAGAGSLKILASGRGDNKVNRIETPNASGTGMTALTANTDALISFKARWVVGSQTILTNGFDHEMARAHALDVPDDLGTPGAPNSVTLRQAGGNLGPVITDVTHEPAVPGAGEPVIVRAKVTDPDGVGPVQLRYALNNPSATPATVAMTLLEDDVYQGTIPGQTLGTKVVAFITAADGGGRPARYPADITTRTHPLLLNPPTAGLNDHRYFIYRHDTRLPTTYYQNYRFVMTDANETTIDQRARLSNDLVDGSFVFGGSTVYYESGMRFAGSPWARAKWGSARVVPPRDQPFHGRLRRIHLEEHHGNGLDARERVSHYLIRHMNQGPVSVPYSDLFVMARWQVNGRGSAQREHVWVPDNDFLDRWFPGDDEGDFLEMDDRFLIGDGADPGRVHSEDGRVLYPPPYNGVPGSSPAVNDANGQNKENYRWFFSLRAKSGADDYGNFVNFARLMDQGDTPNAVFDEQIFDQANVEEFLRIFAVEFNISDWDTWGAERGKNCYFYRPEATGQWHLLAWDLELTYETGRLDQFLIPATPSEAFNPGGFAEVNRLLNRPKTKRMYYSILDEMVNGSGRWFHSSYLSSYMNKLAALGMGNTGIGLPGGYVDQRASRIQSRIQAAVSPQVDLAISSPTSAATYSTNQPTVNVGGTAPAEVCEIFVGRGGPEAEVYPVVYTSMTNWTITGIPLIPGPNPLTFIGFDLRGNPIDSDTLTVTSTANWNAPAISSLAPDTALSGTDIEVFGSDFHDGVRVFFGATQSARVVFSEADPPPQRILARVPAGTGTLNVTARNVDNRTSNAVPFTYVVPPSQFIRGDANGDGAVSISDGVKVLRHLFAAVTTDCQDALDTDDNEILDITDAIRILDYLFQNGPAPAAPFPSAGVDPAGAGLGCSR